MNNKEIGNLGEGVVCGYLIKNGSKIIKRNFKSGFDEIDVIAKDSDGTLVFIEVKTAFAAGGWGAGFMPEDQMTDFKMKKISRACQRFAVLHPDLVDDEKGWRIDLVAVTLETETTGILHHYKNL